MIQNPDDLPWYVLPGAEAEREASEATNPVPVQIRAETFKALLRDASSALAIAARGA